MRARARATRISWVDLPSRIDAPPSRKFSREQTSRAERLIRCEVVRPREPLARAGVYAADRRARAGRCYAAESGGTCDGRRVAARGALAWARRCAHRLDA